MLSWLSKDQALWVSMKNISTHSLPSGNFSPKILTKPPPTFLLLIGFYLWYPVFWDTDTLIIIWPISLGILLPDFLFQKLIFFFCHATVMKCLHFQKHDFLLHEQIIIWCKVRLVITVVHNHYYLGSANLHKKTFQISTFTYLQLTKSTFFSYHTTGTKLAPGLIYARSAKHFTHACAFQAFHLA